MWLINAVTLKLQEFTGQQTPPYAILSHCWGENEMNFKDFRKRQHCSGPAYQKIVDCCGLVRSRSFTNESEPLQWVWIDTACIDKRSSAELSEAINSMWDWYQNAAVCFAYLADVTADAEPSDEVFCQPTFDKDDEPEYFQQFRRSRWFTRGWTLQELLAPQIVFFVDSSWRIFGLRDGAMPWLSFDSYKVRRRMAEARTAVLTMVIADVTRIPAKALMARNYRQFSVAQRMSWASGRRSTRLEDESYCLMGLFDINMPLLYGEGERAYRRLQQEILHQHADDSLFAWVRTRRTEGHHVYRLLAQSPADFEGSANVRCLTSVGDSMLSIKGQGFRLKVPPSPQQAVFYHSKNPSTFLLRLQCGRRRGDAKEAWLSPMIVMLRRQDCGHYVRERPSIRRVRPFGPHVSDKDAAAEGGSAELAALSRGDGYSFEDEEGIEDPEKWLPVKGPETYYIHNDWAEYSHCMRFREQTKTRFRVGCDPDMV